MRVYVGSATPIASLKYRLISGDRLNVHYDWVPDKMHTEIDVAESACQLAADGDGGAQRFIEGMARRSIEQQLIADLKRVIGPNWSRCLEVLIEREDILEAKHDKG